VPQRRPSDLIYKTTPRRCRHSVRCRTRGTNPGCSLLKDDGRGHGSGTRLTARANCAPGLAVPILLFALANAPYLPPNLTLPAVGLDEHRSSFRSRMHSP
jgi:hypothetical protein